LGMHAFQHGRLAEALGHLQAAHAVTPQDPLVLLSISNVLREQGDDAGELRTIDAALAIDQYFLHGLLAKAHYLARHRGPKAAAVAYGNALKVAPPEPHWPQSLRSQLLYARTQIQGYGRELAAFLAERTGTRLAALTPIQAQRWREAGAILSGQSRPYPSQCSRLYVPRLPAIPFFERDAFDWVEALEAQTGAITAELEAALTQQQDEFKPYVAYEPGAPVNQWHELNHSRRWSSYFLWRNGEPVAEHQRRCPCTTQALAVIGMADIAGLCPNAMFSALAPRTRIPPHSGETNARVIVHLPLVVPDNCLYRVGFEQRHWEVGKVLIFDDSIEHEARNDSGELRVVLIFDVWNPLLSAGELDMVRTLSVAAREFHEQT
ncbi:MAG: aspartyl/asparaginyl beta-hydroxylase domain-containing protein, partial [Luteimonas sp.]